MNAPSVKAPAQFGPAFRRIFNLRVVAAVYYFCLLNALSQAVGWFDAEQATLHAWLFDLVRFTRQTLFTGLSLLLLVALAEGLMAARSFKAPMRVAIATLAVLTGATLGVFLRYVVANYDEPQAGLEWGWMVSTLALWALLGGMAYTLLFMLRAQQQARDHMRQLSREREALEARQMEAQVSALHAQIEPHFLFNTLANVKRLYETTPERGRDMLQSLIKYLRAALPSMRRQDSTLGQELELVHNYLTILQMRMGERLSFDIEAEPALLAARLPPMVLPTLVENAIKHGLSPLPEGGRIEIRAVSKAGSMNVEVRDNGCGFAASCGTGVGLANTRARLEALFGSQAALELESVLPRGVIARVRLPLERVARTESVEGVA